ncbi:MAG: translation initiation factor [Sulfurovum sp.]|nr:translation initiation factor [Sulfurovum sp.]
MNNVFEMGAKFGDEWSADNKDKPNKVTSTEIKAPNKHQLHFAKEKRRGKVVTIVKPFYLDKKELQTLLKILKKKLCTGGTIKENSLEFQGDISEQVREQLDTLRYSFKC